MSDKRYLVVVRAGDRSLHQEWTQRAENRSFDLCISYCGDQPGRYKEESDFYFEGQGAKFSALFELLEQWGERINQYDAVWFPDDDIRTDTSTIDRMFHLFSEYKLMLAQPALTKNAYAQVTAQHIDYKVRYTYFVEPTSPIFSKEALGLCRHTFNLSLNGSRLPWIWAKLLGTPHKQMAVIDDTPVKRTTPVHLDNEAESIEESDELEILEALGIAVSDLRSISFYDGVKKWDPYPDSAEKAAPVTIMPDKLSRKKLIMKPKAGRRAKVRSRIRKKKAERRK